MKTTKDNIKILNKIRQSEHLIMNIKRKIFNKIYDGIVLNHDKSDGYENEYNLNSEEVTIYKYGSLLDSLQKLIDIHKKHFTD